MVNYVEFSKYRAISADVSFQTDTVGTHENVTNYINNFRESRKPPR